MPNAVGEILAESDLKDLGMHTELCSDAYLELYHSGKLTNRLKNLNKELDNSVIIEHGKQIETHLKKQ